MLTVLLLNSLADRETSGFSTSYFVTAITDDLNRTCGNLHNCLDNSVGELAGIAVGAVVMVDILIAGPSTGGSMNPIRTLGPAVAAGNYDGLWIYMVAPTLGALAGAAIYTSVKLREDEVQPSRSVRSFGR